MRTRKADRLRIHSQAGEVDVSPQELKRRATGQGVADFLDTLYNIDAQQAEVLPEILRVLNLLAGEMRTVSGQFSLLNNNITRIAASLESNTGNQPIPLERRLHNVLSDALLNAALSLEDHFSGAAETVNSIPVVEPNQPTCPTKEPVPVVSSDDSETAFILEHYPEWAQTHVIDIFNRMYQTEQELGIKITSITLLREYVPKVEHRIYSSRYRIWESFKDFMDSYNMWLDIKKSNGTEIIVDV